MSWAIRHIVKPQTSSYETVRSRVEANFAALR